MARRDRVRSPCRLTPPRSSRSSPSSSLASPAHPPLGIDNLTYMLWPNRRGSGRLICLRAATDSRPTWSRDPQPSRGSRSEHRSSRRRGQSAYRLRLAHRGRQAKSNLDRPFEPGCCTRRGAGRSRPARCRTAQLLAMAALKGFVQSPWCEAGPSSRAAAPASPRPRWRVVPASRLADHVSPPRSC
jgi:hypothetical protein